MSELIDIITSLLTLAAVIVSAFSTFLAKKALDAQTLVSKNAALVSQTQRNENSLSQDAKLLELYNIQLSELESNGIKPEELVFIWSDLRQGQIYHSIENYESEILSDYRKNFLLNRKVQIAFVNFINGKLLSKTSYTEEVEKFINNNKRY